MPPVMDAYFGSIWWARFGLQRGLAAIYLIAFVSALAQFKALLGERGLLPTPEFLRRSSFGEAPSLFHLRYDDRLFSLVAGSAVVG